MEFDHEYIDKNEILSKYLLHELSSEETDKFEEHLLFCSVCRENIIKSGKAIEAIHAAFSEVDISEIKKDQGKGYRKPKPTIGQVFKIAASILVLVALGVWLYFSLNKGRVIIHEKVTEKLLVDTLEQEDKDTVFPQNDVPPNTLIAVAAKDTSMFLESLFFEKVIPEVSRGVKVQVKTPKMGQKFKGGSKITFEWEGTEGEIYLTVFNNKDELLFEHLASSPYVLKKDLSPGLYYWQLENEDDALYTGKFLVR